MKEMGEGKSRNVVEESSLGLGMSTIGKKEAKHI